MVVPPHEFEKEVVFKWFGVCENNCAILFVQMQTDLPMGFNFILRVSFIIICISFDVICKFESWTLLFQEQGM